MTTNQTEGHEINLENIVKRLHEAGFPDASVEQTGGGTATVIVGSEGIYGLGPGWFDGPGYTEGRAWTDGLCYGSIEDDNDCHYFEDPNAVTEDVVFEAFLAYLRKTPLAKSVYVKTTHPVPAIRGYHGEIDPTREIDGIPYVEFRCVVGNKIRGMNIPWEHLTIAEDK